MSIVMQREGAESVEPRPANVAGAGPSDPVDAALLREVPHESASRGSERGARRSRGGEGRAQEGASRGAGKRREEEAAKAAAPASSIGNYPRKVAKDLFTAGARKVGGLHAAVMRCRVGGCCL